MQAEQTNVSVYFSPQIDKYLASWILSSTWYESYQLDKERFYNFVNALNYYEYGNRFDESLLREKVLAAVKRNDTFTGEAAEDIIDGFVTNASLILYFLKVTRRFPIPDIEEWNPPLK